MDPINTTWTEVLEARALSTPAIIASLLISLWTGAKPCKATFTMINFYLMGWADDEELGEYVVSILIR